MLRLAALLTVLAAPAWGSCRLALLLALDISSSVDATEDRLQREGLARALASDEVIAAALSVPGQSVALAVYEWSGRFEQAVTLPWRVLYTREDVLLAAVSISTSRRPDAEFPTAIGYAIHYAARTFRDAPPCEARTLDISGDGVNNDGFGPRLAYTSVPLQDVTVNGLVIGGAEDGLADYYRREVIQGPGAFVEEARDFLDYERAMKRKLERELRALTLSELDD